VALLVVQQIILMAIMTDMIMIGKVEMMIISIIEKGIKPQKRRGTREAFQKSANSNLLFVTY